MARFNTDVVFIDGSGQVRVQQGDLTLRANDDGNGHVIVGSGVSLRPDIDYEIDLGQDFLRWRTLHAGSGSFSDGATISGVPIATLNDIGSSTPVDQREVEGNIIPDTDNVYDLGSVTRRYNEFFATSGVFGDNKLRITNQITITNDDTEPAITITQNANAAGIEINNNSNSAGIDINNAGSEPGIDITQNGNDEALRILQTTNRDAICVQKTGTGTGDTIQANSAGTGRVIIAQQTGGGRGIDILQTSANLAFLIQKTDTGNNEPARIENAGTGPGMIVDNTNDAAGIEIDCVDSTYTNDGLRVNVSGFTPVDFNLLKLSNPSGVQCRVRGDGTLFATSGVFGDGTTFINGNAVMCDTLRAVSGSFLQRPSVNNSGVLLQGEDGITSFIGLTDTPSTYTGASGQVPAGNADEDGLTFIHPFVMTTTETDTGITWWTGQNIYRKIVQSSGVVSVGGTGFAHNISNLDKIIHVYGFLRRDDASSSQLPVNFPIPDTMVGGQISVHVTDTNLVLNLGSAWTGAGFTLYDPHFVVEYTKTS